MDEVEDDPGVSDRADFVITGSYRHPADNPADISVDRGPGEPGGPTRASRRRSAGGRLRTRGARRTPGSWRGRSTNIVSNEEDNASVVAKITAGEADAAIVYTSDISDAAGNDVNAVDDPRGRQRRRHVSRRRGRGGAPCRPRGGFVDLVVGSRGQGRSSRSTASSHRLIIRDARPPLCDARRRRRVLRRSRSGPGRPGAVGASSATSPSGSGAKPSASRSTSRSPPPSSPLCSVSRSPAHWHAWDVPAARRPSERSSSCRWRSRRWSAGRAPRWLSARGILGLASSTPSAWSSRSRRGRRSSPRRSSRLPCSSSPIEAGLRSIDPRLREAAARARRRASTVPRVTLPLLPPQLAAGACSARRRGLSASSARR